MNYCYVSLDYSAECLSLEHAERWQPENVQFIRIEEAQYHTISRRRCLHARNWTHLFAQRSRRAAFGRIPPVEPA